MAKRKNGEGTYYIRKNGKYKYYAYRFPDGKEINGHTAQERDEKIKAYAEQLEKGSPKIDNLFVFSDYCKLWLKTRREYMTAGCFDDYESIINNRIAKYSIGNMQIKSLTVNAFNVYLLELSKKYSKKTIDNTWIVCKQVLKYGFENRDIPFIDIEKIIKPKESQVAVHKKQVPFTNEEDLKLLQAEIKKGNYGNASKAILFIAHSGLRVSELIALKWENVAEDLSYITIAESNTKAIIRDENNEPVLVDGKKVYQNFSKTTKTENGFRKIPVSKQGKTILKYFKKYEKKKTDYVFVTDKGKRFARQRLDSVLKTILANAKSKKMYSLHSLRHGYATMLIKKGIDFKVVCDLMGHSDIKTTFNFYVGVTEEDKAEAIKSVFDGL